MTKYKGNLRWTVPSELLETKVLADPNWVTQLINNRKLKPIWMEFGHMGYELTTDWGRYQLEAGTDLIYDPDTNEVSEVLGKVNFKNEEDV